MTCVFDFYRKLHLPAGGARPLRSAVAITHRDWLWAAQGTIEGLDRDELLRVDSNAILPAHIIHYTTINPETSQEDPARLWRRSICPWADSEATALAAANWEEIEL